MTEPRTEIPPLHDVDIRILRIFKVVVEAGGFSAAEETLGIATSTISKHISGFEDRLNMRLCERGRAGFTVTPYGQTVYNATIELLDALDIFRSKVSSAKGRLSGSVTLWTMDNSHNEQGNPLVKALSHFQDRPGKVQITLNAADPKSVEEAVSSGLAHVGITIANAGLPGIVYEKLGKETTSLYCSHDHWLAGKFYEGPVSSEDLLQCDFIMRSYLRHEQHLPEHILKTSASAGHVEATLQLILTGAYVGILPDHIAARWRDQGKIVRIENSDFYGATTVFVAYRSNATFNPTVAALLEDIRSGYLVP